MPGSTPNPRRTAWLLALGVAIATLTFIVDLRSPAGVAVPVVYVLVIPLGLWLPWPAYPLIAASTATVLMAIDADLSPEPGNAWYMQANHVLSLVVLWTTAFGVRRHQRIQLRLARHTGALQHTLKELSDIKYALDQSAIVATTDRRGLITYVNDKFCEISKYSAEELLGQDHRIINSGYHPKDFMRTLWNTIASGRIWRGEIRNRAKDGTFYWVDTTIVPFLDAQGKPYQYMAIRYEITERKRVEEQIREQAALTRLGQMAAVVAHEVKNPLAGLRGALQVIGSRMPAAGPDQGVVREMVARIDALNELIQDLLVYARPRPPQMTTVPVGTLVREMAAQLRKDPAQGAIEVDIEGVDQVVQADLEMLRASFFNLLLNAAQAMHGNGRIQVTMAKKDGMCQIVFRDHGPGIEEGVRERIFEPFFTTRHRGSGLGLPIVKRTMELHGGSVALDYPPDGGTRVVLSLPLGRRPA